MGTCQLLRDIILRLQLDSKSAPPMSKAARDHGELRFRQGYSAAMVVEESRMLQVSIFSTLRRNSSCVNITQALLDVVIIAHECDSQLTQAIGCYDAHMDCPFSSPLHSS
jgi:hypothetical protein